MRLARTFVLILIVAGFLRFNCLLASYAQEVDVETPQSIVQKAVLAAGGKAEIKKSERVRLVTTGKGFFGSDVYTFRTETWEDPPERRKSIFHAEAKNLRMTVISVTNGDKSWVNRDGATKELSDDDLQKEQIFRYEARIGRLYPLLDDPSFVLTLLKEEKAANRTLLGVRISMKGKDSIDIYFDKETYLPMKTARTSTIPSSKGKLVEVYWENYKNVQNRKIPFRSITFVNGTKTMEADVTSYEILDRVDPTIFAKP